MKPGAIIAFIVLVGAAITTFLSFSQATVKHVTIAEAMASPGKTVQVPGQILKETVSFRIHDKQPELRFVIVDMQGGSQRMTVVYRKPRPENFHNATSVEAIGQYKDGVFEASTLLVKCPSKYQGKDAARWPFRARRLS